MSVTSNTHSENPQGKKKKKNLHKSESWYQSDHKSQTCKNVLKLPKAHKKVMNKMVILKASWREKELSEP